MEIMEEAGVFTSPITNIKRKYNVSVRYRDPDHAQTHNFNPERLDKMRAVLDVAMWKMLGKSDYFVQEMVPGKYTVRKKKPKEITAHTAKDPKTGIRTRIFRGDLRFIISTAKELGVVPEVLVDEYYYIQKYGATPYRLALAILQSPKFAGIRDFYRYCTNHFPFFCSQQNFWNLLHDASAHKYSLYVPLFIEVCKLVDFQPRNFFTTVRNPTTMPLQKAFSEAILPLNNTDLAFLAGVAKVLSQKEQNSFEKLENLWKWRQITYAREA